MFRSIPHSAIGNRDDDDIGILILDGQLNSRTILLEEITQVSSIDTVVVVANNNNSINLEMYYGYNL